MRAIVALLVLTFIVGGGNLLASWDQVQQYKASQQREQAAQQRQAAAEQAAQRRQGELLEQRLCATLDPLAGLAGLKPPAGNPADNPSRAFEQRLVLKLAPLGQLAPDLGCEALHAARLPPAADCQRMKPSLLRPAILGGFDGMASLLGVILYLLITGHPALIFVGIGVSVSAMRPNRGPVLALAETFGILTACLAAAVACALLLPGGAA
jgi:hypothetical protein